MIIYKKREYNADAGSPALNAGPAYSAGLGMFMDNGKIIILAAGKGTRIGAVINLKFVRTGRPVYD